MLGKEAVRRLNITVSSGSGTGTITAQWDIARRVRIIPPAETDTYDMDIKDDDGHLIMSRTGQLGTLSELQEVSLGIAKTINITNASADGSFIAKLDLH